MTARTAVACAVGFACAAVFMRAAEPTTYGTGVSISTVTPMADVIARPADFEGDTVRVEGVVRAVCSEMGCWMALAPSESDGPTLLLKVDDGVIVFPVTAKGRRVAAQGVIERVGSNHESQAAANEQAHATGQAAARYQLKATGALVF